ncbi:hypothetical protein AX14_004578 [Amanita brunnescens Koide BX004]|nr:hypothetical protein AX14_004578 [Amanita brunnescens Koide BX004]
MFLNTFLAQSQPPNDLGSQADSRGTPAPGNNNDDGSSLSGEEGDEPELQPPPSTQVPRPPPSESGSSSASVPFSPRTQRTIKTFADRTCRDFHLPDGSLDTFSSLPNMSCMLVHFMGALIKSNQVQQTESANKLLESQEYQAMLSERLLTVLLSPSLTAYCTGLAAHIIEFIGSNLSTFKTPPEVYQDPELKSEFSSLVKALLTQNRSVMKQKLIKGINNSLQIIDLAKSIAPPSIELTLAHICRIAFLRITLLEFAQQDNEENPAANNPRTTSFWGTVDDHLEQLRTAERENNNPRLVKEFFTTALQLDLKKYAGQYPKPSQLAGPEWQKIVEQGAHFVPN